MPTRSTRLVTCSRRLALTPIAVAGLLSGAALMTAGAAPALGQTSTAPAAEAATMAEIVVTARRRAERLQDVPLAVTAVGGEELEDRQVASVADLAGLAPNVDFSTSPSGGGAGLNSQITIRGIGQTDFLITTDPGVGVYVDGVYFARATGGVLDLVDLERIEILRGPQGSLYGRNTIGGAINIVSAKPTGEFGGKVEASLGNYDFVQLRGAVDFSLVPDKLAAKLSFQSTDSDGYAKRILTGEELGDRNTSTLRGVLLWEPGDAVTTTLIADYSRARQNSAASAAVSDFTVTPLVTLYNALVPARQGTPAVTDASTGSLLRTRATGFNENRSDVWGVSATMDADLGAASLKSITAYRHLDVAFGRDGDNSPVVFRETRNEDEQWQFSQEFQLAGEALDDRLNWLLGAYYFRETAEDVATARLASGLFPALEALARPLNGSACAAPFTAPGCRGNPLNIGFDLDFDVFNQIKVESLAPFAHATFALSDRLSASLGLRYTHEEKKYALIQRRANSGVLLSNIPTSDPLEAEFSDFSPKVGVEYRPAQDVLLYATYTQGFRSGGFNGRPTGTQAQVTSYDPEHLSAYEAGIKSAWLDRRLTLNLAGFYSDYRDIQLTAVVSDPATGLLLVTVDNAAKGRVQGAELELRAVPVTGLTLSGSLGYADTKYTDVGTATSITATSVFVKTPKWSSNFFARYDWELDSGAAIGVQGDWSYRSRVFNDVQNTASIAQDGFSLFNARLTYVAPEERWEVSAFARNLFDKRYIVNGVSGGAFGLSEAAVGRPREYGLSLRANF